MRQAEADVAARKAEVARAKLNLDYATIRAPINGRIGAALVSEGALVVPNDTTNLASIQQLDPIYADFTQSVSDLNKLRRAFVRGDLEQIAPGAAKVKLVVDDGMIAVVILALLMVPVFFVSIQRVFSRSVREEEKAQAMSSELYGPPTPAQGSVAAG